MTRPLTGLLFATAWQGLLAEPLKIQWQDIGQPLVSSLGLSPDGAVLASATQQAIVLRETGTGTVVRTLPLYVPWHGCEVAYSPNGSLLAAAIWSDGQGALRVFETAFYNSLGQTVERDLRFVREIKWSADGSAVFTVGSADRAERYDPVLVRRTRVYPTQGREALDLDVSPDGQWLALALRTGSVAFYQTEASPIVFELEDPTAEASSVLFDSIGNRVWVGRSDGKIAEWDLTVRIKTREIQVGTEAVTQMEMSGDASTMVFATEDGWVGSLDPGSLTVKSLSKGHVGPIDDVAASPDGRSAYSASRFSGFKSRLVFWDLTNGKPLFDAFNLDGTSYWHAHTPDGLRLFQGVDSRSLIERDAEDGRIVKELNLEGGFRTAAMSPDGDWIAVSTGSRYPNPIHLFSLPDGRFERTLSGQDGVQSLSFSPDSSVLVSAGYDGRVTAWSTASGAKLYERTGLPVFFGNIDHSPDGRRLLVCLNDRTVILDAKVGTTLAQVTHQQSSLFNQARFSPDGRLLAVANGSQVFVYHSNGFGLLSTLSSGPGFPAGLRFSRDGKWLWRGSADFPGSLIAWETETFAAPKRFEESSQAWVINAVGFSPDGQSVTFAREDPSLVSADLPMSEPAVAVAATRASDGGPLDTGQLALEDGYAAQLRLIPGSSRSEAVMEGVSPLSKPLSLQLALRARSMVSALAHVSAFDFQTSQFVHLGQLRLGSSWESKTWTIEGPLRRFVGPRHQVRARVTFQPSRPLTSLAPWAELDTAGWTVGVR